MKILFLFSLRKQIGQDIDGEEGMDASGHSVSLSFDGSVVAVGAPSNSGPNFDFSPGHVRVFEVEGTKEVFLFHYACCF